MNINRHNYEVFLVDYLDGKLNSSLTGELMAFLDQNPDIRNELDGLQEAVLVGESVTFPNRSNLKKKSLLKNGIDDEFEYLCLASVEASISSEEKNSLENITKNNNKKQNEFKIFQKTIITSDPTIKYPHKPQLKRTVFVPIRYSTLRTAIGIAASVALLLGVYTIGKVLINDSAIKEITTTNIATSSNLPIKSTIQKSSDKISTPTETKTIHRFNKKEAIKKATIVNLVAEKAKITPADSIPDKIISIEPKAILIRNDLQVEQLALIAATYSYYNHLPNEHLYAQQESNIDIPQTKEIGVFEIIQYGVQSFGNLIGSDVRLRASKDKKGKIKKISFESKLIAFSTPLGKND